MNDLSSPARRDSRPPTPAWLWIVFLLAPTLLCVLAATHQPGRSPVAVLRDGAIGLLVGLLLAGGWALSERCFARPMARAAGGLVFAALLAVSGAAVGFGGCVPYPYVHTVTPRRAAVSGDPRTGRPVGNPAASPQPSPQTKLEVRWWPEPFGQHYDD